MLEPDLLGPAAAEPTAAGWRFFAKAGPRLWGAGTDSHHCDVDLSGDLMEQRETRLLRGGTVDPLRLGALAYGLLILSLIIAFLYLGRPILEPLVIASLLAFILSPLIRRLRQWGVWRVPSVVLAVAFTLGLLGALGTVIAIQITQLAEALPTYETNLRAKIRALGTGRLTSGALERASGTLKDLQEEISKAGPTATPGQKPMLVEVRQPEPRGLETIA